MDTNQNDNLSRADSFDRNTELYYRKMPSVGYMLPTLLDLKECLSSLTRNGYDFMTIKIVTKRFDKLIPVSDNALNCIGDFVSHVASYIDTSDCYDSENFNSSYIESSLLFSRHFSLKNIIIECPQEFDAITRLAQLVAGKIINYPSYANVILHVPLQSPIVQSRVYLKDEPSEIENTRDYDTWKLFNHFRTNVGYDTRLGVCLEICGELPSVEAQKRWLAEPIKMIMINPYMFQSDKETFVKIPEPWMEFIASIIKSSCRKISFLIKGQIPPDHMYNVSLYLSEIFDKYRSSALIDEFATGYENLLQAPLQPLADNLEAGTYETFEKDPVKYNKYSDAITVGLRRLPKNVPVVILLVGAGRGPLIRAALISAAETGHEIHLYAIEKNVCAANTLESQNLVCTIVNLHPKSFVKIVNSDIRDWEAPELADIVISELLGSFGDNELSPECLDGAWRCVKPSAISIPGSYRSYLGPVMSSKLYSDTTNDGDKQSKTDHQYVSLMKGFYPIDDPKVLFTFNHNDLSKSPRERDNRRYKNVEFKAKIDCVLHGFAGYFDCTLIDDIELSIAPHNFSHNLISWFPMWIPLSKPVDLKCGQTISVHFWRNVSKSSVWYEWCISEPEPTQLQNVGGRSQSIGLY